MASRRVISIVIVSDIPTENYDEAYGPMRSIAPYDTGSGVYEFEVNHATDTLEMSHPQIDWDIGLGIKWIRNTNKTPFSNQLLADIPEQYSDEHILNALPDDCIEAVFACGILQQYDLIHIVPTVCKRFEPIAKMVFKSKYCYRNNVTTMGDMNSEQRMWQFPEYLRAFGDIISTMFAAKRLALGNILNLIEANCSQITELKLNINVDGTGKTPLQIRDAAFTNEVCSLMMRAEKMVLSNFNSFGGDPYSLLLPEITCKKLVDFTLLACELFDNVYGHERQYQFYALNPQLKRVSIVKCSSFCLCPELTTFLPNLEVLYVYDSGYESIDGAFNHLKRLREYHIHGPSYPRMLRILQEIKSSKLELESLTANCIDFYYRHGLPIVPDTMEETQQAVETICSMPTLKSLEIYDINSAQVMQILRCVNINTLIVNSSWKFVFDAIVTILHEIGNRRIDVTWLTEYHDGIWTIETLDTIASLLQTNHMNVRIELINIDHIVDRYGDWLTIEKNPIVLSRINMNEEDFHGNLRAI